MGLIHTCKHCSNEIVGRGPQARFCLACVAAGEDCRERSRRYYQRHRDDEAIRQFIKRRRRPWIKAEQNKRYRDRVNADPERREHKRLKDHADYILNKPPPKPPKPKRTPKHILKRAAYLAFQEVLSPKPPRRCVLIVRKSSMWRDHSSALPFFLPPSIKDVVGNHFDAKRTRTMASDAYKRKLGVPNTRKGNIELRRATRRWRRQVLGPEPYERHRTDAQIKRDREKGRQRDIEEQAAFELAAELGLFDQPNGEHK